MMKEVNQDEWGGSGKDVTLEVNTITSSPVREQTTSGRHWKSKKPGSLLGDLREASSLEPSSIFLKQHTSTASPGGSSWGAQRSRAGVPCTPQPPKHRPPVPPRFPPFDSLSFCE